MSLHNQHPLIHLILSYLNSYSYVQVSDVLVRTRFTETLCPVLSKQQRDPIAVEKEIRHILGEFRVICERVI